MYRRATAALLMLGMIGGTAAAQTPGTPAQPGPIRTDQVPVFRVTVVGRTIPAINYRPRRGATKVDFVGTALMPRARGQAKVEGKRGYMELDVRVDELEPPARFGPEYLTYVLWAVTPEGRAKNLGEIQIDDDDDTLDVTTDLQAFGLIVTAEPYFAVTQPSDVVVMENVVRNETEGRVEPIQAKYELLKRGTYLMQHEASDLKVKSLEPGAPLDLAQARNAVMLARFAGADRYAADTFGKALALLRQAEEARERRSRGNNVMMPARQAVQTAEDARIIALEKQEEAYLADQQAARREAEAARAAEEARRQQAERDADSVRRETEREKEALRRQSELEIESLRKQAELEKEAVRRQAEVDTLTETNARLAAEREKAAADAARAAAETETARQAAEARAREAQEAAARAEREQTELRERLREQLNVILETRETARGLVVNVSDVLFDTASANLKAGAREKLARVAGVLLSQPSLQVTVEGHTDSVGSEDYNQGLSERRASSVRDYLVRQGIAPGAVGTAGFGESQPVVSNNTSAGRQQNRRVEIVISGEALGTKTTTTLRRNQ